MKKTESKATLQRRFNEARAELELIEHKERRERNKALVGTCYKYRNAGHGSEERWWLYIKVTRMSDDGRWPEAIFFQKTTYGTLEICEKSFTPGSGYQEISQDELAKAWREFLKDVIETPLP